METLATITQTDINNGVLIRMLANAGIPDVQEYVKNFHRETEELILEEFEHFDPNKVDNDEQIVPPADIEDWITSFRPQFDDHIQPLPFNEQKRPLPYTVENWMADLQPNIGDSTHKISNEPQPTERQRQLPSDVQGWITGLRLRLDDPPQPPLPDQEQQKQTPSDLKTWMQRITPIDTQSSTTPVQPSTIPQHQTPINGNLGSWIHDWSKSLSEQPPPTSLDNWLQHLIPTDIHEPINKSNASKARLNTYLNAAEQVLSQHGYNLSTQITPSTINLQTKTKKFGNVRQMYFLWKTLDKNHDRKITVEDVQILLQEMGLGFLSKYVAQTLFDMVDSNHDGELQFRDFIALMGIIKQLVGAVGSTKA